MVVKEIPLGTPAQDWARLLNLNFSIMDYHDHTLQNSLQIDSKFLGVGDLDVNNQNVRNVGSFQFQVNAFPDHPLSLFVDTDNDLCYMDNNGVLKITSGSGLNIVDQPEGFTVTGTAPVAAYDPSTNSLLFKDSAGNNTATLEVETLNCDLLSSEGDISVTAMNPNATLQNKQDKGKLFGVSNSLPTITYRAFDTSFRAYETADIYKVSENGVFYYDNLAYNQSNSYDSSYYLGAKNLILSNSSVKQNKAGIRYYTEYRDFSIGLITRETFVVIPLLENQNLVSFIPKVMTTSLAEIGYTNPILRTMTLPTFNVIINETSVEVAVNMDLSPLEGIIDPNVTLRFSIVYADRNFAIRDE